MFDMEKFVGGLKGAENIPDGKSQDDVALLREVLEWQDCSQAESLKIEDYARLLENIESLAEQVCQFYDISKSIENRLQVVNRVPQRRLL